MTEEAGEIMAGPRGAGGWAPLAIAAVALAVGCGGAPSPTGGDDDAGAPRAVPWQAGPTMPGPRTFHAAVVFRDTLYVAGGVVGPGQLTASVIRIGAGASVWEEFTPLPKELMGTSLVVAADTLWAVGGDGPQSSPPNRWIFAWVPEAGAWQFRTHVPDWRSGTDAVAVAGEIWLTGGPVIQQNDHSPDTPGDKVLVYTPGADAWRYEERLLDPRIWHEAVLGSDGLPYVVGGAASNQENQLTQVNVYDPPSRTWLPVTGDLWKASHVAAAAVGDRIHIFGGIPEYQAHRALDVRTREWIEYESLPDTYWASEAVVFDGWLWLLGGRGEAGRQDPRGVRMLAEVLRVPVGALD